ncbi:hypothetical protein HYW82_01755 [Candidatus Peregrinibacteria bacterium]|nr:hypothetical protein [Candidatus Peregrinibacteria bacterium]
MNKLTKKSVIGALAAVILTGAAFNISTYADENTSPDCSEIIQYFSERLDTIDDSAVYEGSTDCDNSHFEPFPGRHTETIDPSTHQATDKTAHQPFSEHSHTYINQSEENIGTQYNYYTRAIIDTFEIKLHEDFQETIDFDSIECSGLPENNNCTGEKSSGSRTYTVTFDRTNGIIQWRFTGEKPKIAGKNPHLDQLRGTPGYSSEEINRMVKEGISFKTNEQEKEFWSATSTAKILIKDQFAKLPASATTSVIGTLAWQDAEPAGADPDNDKFYWFDIGTTSTVWQKEIAQVEEACKDIQIDHPEDIYEGTLSRFRARAISGGTGETLGGKIRYSVENGHGAFYATRPENLPTFILNSSRMINEIPLTSFMSTNILEFINELFGEERSPIPSIPTPADFGSTSVVEAATVFSAGGNTVEVDPYKNVYFMADQAGNDVIHIQPINDPGNYCKRDFDIIPKNACANLELISNPTAPLTIGQNAELNLVNPLDINGNPLPPSTKIVWSSGNTRGRFTYGDRTGRTLTLNLDQQPVQISGIVLPGLIQAKVQPGDLAYSNKCQPTISVELPLACKNLRLQVQEFNKNEFGANETKYILESNGFYKVEGYPAFTRPNSEITVGYTIDPDFGTFVKISSDSSSVWNILTINALRLANNLTPETLETTLGSEKLNKTITLPQGKKAHLITFSNNEHSSDAALRVKATGFNCGAAMEFKGIADVLQSMECLDLEIIEPSEPWYINDKDTETIKISATTDPAGKEEDLHFTWKVSNGGKWEETDTALIEAKKTDTTQTLKDFTKDTVVEVWAEENKNACYDKLTARELEKPGEEPEKEVPEINKFAFSENDIDHADDDIINISSETDYVTYMIAYTPGDYNSVSIQETSLENGEIRSIGNLNGSLKFTAMNITILKDGASQAVKILQTAGYRDDYQDRRAKTTAKDYSCENNNDDFCFEDDAEELVNKFKNGRTIRFNNTDELGTDGKLIIKYQLANKSEIDEDTCKKMSADKGCGEEFRNEAKFVAYTNDNYEGDKYEDKDSAKVIVICPYILTRSGGDIFFYDALDTGVDVAACAPVKGSDGPVVTPERPEKPRPPVTGAGDLPEAISYLNLPSHDICRYSNLESNIENYNDALKNFSSTICELRAEVADSWQEENIVKSIAANITRIARFGENLLQSELDSILDLTTTANRQSGVFVRTSGDLEIGNNGVYFIKTGNNIPAAQTYIIRGHDLYINSNIEYGPTDYSKPKSIPSAAFIVLDGNIHIDKDVSRIDGIFMAVDLNRDGSDGKITSEGGKTTTRLLINGNLIGNVYDLFKNRTGVGDPRKDEGSVTIYYDERILLNTPPGISELIDLQQAIVP